MKQARSKDPVTAETLFEGAWWALEQAGRLLQTATRTFDAGDSSTALAVAMFGREEVGRARLLVDFGWDALQGESWTAEEVFTALERHGKKQARSVTNLLEDVEPDDPHFEVVRQMHALPFDDPRRWELVERLRAMSDEIAAALGARHHRRRMAAVYVDLAGDGKQWHRPAAIARDASRHQIMQAVNVYAVTRGKWDPDMLSSPGFEKAMPAAAALLKSRPPGLELPMPVWPAMVP